MNKLPQTSTKLDDFEILNLVGEGTFSKVFKVLRKSDQQIYALKKILISALKLKERENCLNEVRFLASIKSAHIVGYKESFYDQESYSLCLILEYMAGGNLQEYIDENSEKNFQISEEAAWTYIQQIVNGLWKLHSMSIMHRDIKSANIYMTENKKTLKIGDLNISKICKQGMLYTQLGTPYYSSPEMWKDFPYSFKSDIWSLGCVVYELLMNQSPFYSKDMSQLYDKVVAAQYPPLSSQYSKYMKKFVSMCLQIKPQNRADCQQLMKYISKVSGKLKLENLEKDNEIINSNNSQHNSPNEQQSKNQQEMLTTIKIPRILKNLDNVLPKSNYITYNFNKKQHNKESKVIGHKYYNSRETQQIIEEENDTLNNSELPPILISSSTQSRKNSIQSTKLSQNQEYNSFLPTILKKSIMKSLKQSVQNNNY